MSVVPIAAAPEAALLAARQDGDGCFSSLVRKPDGTEEPDRNAFVTALVLRAVRSLPDEPPLTRLRHRGLDWLERARSGHPPGAFSFWPSESRPRWAASVPPDADDT